MPSLKISHMAAVVTVMAIGSPALAQDNRVERLAFACAPLADDGLAVVYGTGTPRSAFLRAAARDESETLGRLSAQTLPAIFDNWFNDVVTPLIVTNLSR